LAASPFVIALQNSGIKALPSIFDAVILITVISVANSSVYASSRVLTAIADKGFAPKEFAYVDKMGRPLRCLYLSLGFGALAYLSELTDQETVFTWLLSLGGLSAIISWTSICWTHIRFRKAMLLHKRKLATLPYRSPLGLLGSWIGLICNISILLAQVITAVWPIGYGEMSGKKRAQTIFQSCMAFLIVLVMYLWFRFFKGTTVSGIKFISWRKWELNHPRIVWGRGTKVVNLNPPQPVYVEVGVQTEAFPGVMIDVEMGSAQNIKIKVEDREVGVDWSEAWQREDYLEWARLNPEHFVVEEELWWCPGFLRGFIRLFYFPWDRHLE